MLRFGLILGALLAISHDSKACLIFFEAGLQAATPPTLVEALTQHEGRATWQQRAAERQQIADKQWDFRTQNNLSVALAHLGRLDEALDRMQTIERTYPGQRATASNLGTVYELKGENSKAKFWIAEGIRREEKSTGRHAIDGTEWLHLRILDAKLKPRESGSAPISGLDFGTSRLPAMPLSFPKGNDGSTMTLPGVQRALQEQLHERLEFVKAPDPIVGELLLDFANSLAVSGQADDARDVYQLAIGFQPQRADLAQSRFDYFAGTPNYPLQIGLWALGLGTIAAYFGHKKWKEAREWRAIPIQKFDDESLPYKTAYIDCSKYDPFDRS